MEIRTDAELIAAYCDARDETAFTEIVSRHRQMVFRACFRMLGNTHEAEDATQAVFIVLVKKATGLRRVTNLAGWLYRVARNVSYESLRQAKQSRRGEEAVMQQHQTVCENPAGDVDMKEVLKRLDEEINRLSRVLREAVVLRYLEGYSEKEAADRAGCPLGTMKSRASEGLAKLRARIVKSGIVVGAAALVTFLENEAKAAVPESLSVSIASGSTAATGGGKAFFLAERTMKTMFWANVKVAAAFVAGMLLLGGGGLWAVTQAANPGGAPVALSAATQVDTEAGQTILDANGYWRTFCVRGPFVIPLELLKVSNPAATVSKTIPDDITTPPPPADWFQPDFNDAAWMHARGPFPGAYRGHASIWGLNMRHLICVRGKFVVADPAAVRKLTLSMKYAGGVVVYLNGKEVFRQHMPAGEIKPETLADSYPIESYVDSQGKLIPFHDAAMNRVNRGEKDLVDRMAKREAREIKSIALPVQDLRKGVNVLAVEVHAAAHRPEAMQKSFFNDSHPGCWPHGGLNALRLAADAAQGVIEPNLDRPKGFRVWNQDMHLHFNESECADSNDRVAPIRLVGAANGFYSAVVVAGSDAPIEGVKAVVSDLKGPATIPASSIRVRYALISGEDVAPERVGRAFRILEDAPPDRIEFGREKSAVQPVWITVNVAKGTPAGKYVGTLEISATGATAVKVPVDLEVVGWTVPEQPYRSFMSVYHSPESVAMQYKVPLYGEKHWKLMEKSVALLGYLGNNLACVPLVCHTEFGHQESMVTWIKKADGSYDYDFSIFDRYLDLMMKYCRLKIVSCQVNYGGQWFFMDPAKQPVFVTTENSETKKREDLQLPLYVTDEAKKLWRPLIEQVRERLQKKGLEKEWVFGIGHCAGISREVTAFFQDLAPDVRWHIARHQRGRPNEFPSNRLTEWMYIPGSPLPSLNPRYPNDGKGMLSLMMQRIWPSSQPPISMRTAAERAYLMGDSGVGRICLDFWNVNKGRTLIDRWPETGSGLRCPHLQRLAAAGRDSAVSTPRIEALREGLQEMEARMFIEDALAAGKVSGDLAERCRKHVDSRTALCVITHGSADELATLSWQKRAEEVYHLAAEIAAKMNK
ncbi:MAG: sigma-70 family RNA polymerase sigma factor [Planctomycetota bacterium]